MKLWHSLIFCLLTACAGQRSITPLEVTTDVVLIADWAQTSEIARSSGRWVELNPLFGKRPSQERVNWVFAGAILGNTILHRMLPDKYIKKYQLFVIVSESALIAHNYSIGIRAGF